MGEALRVLVVSAAAGSRRLWERAVAAVPGAAVVGAVATPRIGLVKAQAAGVDLVILDLDGTDISPSEAMDAWRAAHPAVEFLLTGERRDPAARKVAAALGKGALEFVARPPEEEAEEARVRQLQGRLGPLVGLCRSRRFARQELAPAGFPEPGPRFGSAGTAMAEAPPAPSRLPGSGLPRVEAVLIAVSTGGPEALGQVLPHLPAELGVPVIVVQHMPEALSASLARDLGSRSGLPVRVPSPGDPVLPGAVYLAPGGRHLLVERATGEPSAPTARRFATSDAPAENSVRPSADPLFRSAASAYDGTVLAVVMTGMGADGLAGVRALKKGHCYCLTQTAETCAVYGMPRCVDDAGLADERVPLGRLAQRIAALVAGRR
ncbi:MAG: CheB methylesterase domain-containing protein [Thermodesulfobacteriota bacterium]